MGFFKWFYKDSAKHHGIKGQKWGVRRYQNYDGSRIKSSEAEYHRYRTGQKKSFDESKSKSGMSAFLSERENRRKSDIWRKDLETGEWETFNQNTQDWAFSNIDPRSADEAMHHANYLRQRDPNNPDWNNNCVNCSVSIINQMKGLGLAAGPNADGVANEAIGYYFDGAKRESPSYDQVEDCIRSHGAGSYGVMGTKTKFGNGHETVWKVNDDLSIDVFDGQSDKKYSFKDYKENMGIEPWDLGTSVYDLTNASPNIAHQAEDHAFFPSVSSNKYDYDMRWNDDSYNYQGPSSENTSFEQRWNGYGLEGNYKTGSVQYPHTSEKKSLFRRLF